MDQKDELKRGREGRNIPSDGDESPAVRNPKIFNYKIRSGPFSLCYDDHDMALCCVFNSLNSTGVLHQAVATQA